MGILNSITRNYSLSYRELNSKKIVSDKLYVLLNQSGLQIVEDLFTEYESPDEFLIMAGTLDLTYDNIELDISVLIDFLNNNLTALPLLDRNTFAQIDWGNNLANKPMITHLTFRELARKKYITKGLYEKLVNQANVKSVGDYFMRYKTPEEFRNDVRGVGVIYMSELVKLLNEMYKFPKKFMQIRNKTIWLKNGFSIDSYQPRKLSPSAQALRFDMLHSKNVIDHTLYYRLFNKASLSSIEDFVHQFGSTENFQYMNGFVGPSTIKRLDVLLDNIESILIVNKCTSFDFGSRPL